MSVDWKVEWAASEMSHLFQSFRTFQLCCECVLGMCVVCCVLGKVLSVNCQLSTVMIGESSAFSADHVCLSLKYPFSIWLLSFSFQLSFSGSWREDFFCSVRSNNDRPFPLLREKVKSEKGREEKNLQRIAFVSVSLCFSVEERTHRQRQERVEQE